MIKTAATNNSDALSTRLCDYLTFTGDPQEAETARPDFYEKGADINPVLTNPNTLTGALVSSFLPEDGSYVDARMTCPDGESYPSGCAIEEAVANPMSRVCESPSGQ